MMFMGAFDGVRVAESRGLGGASGSERGGISRVAGVCSLAALGYLLEPAAK